jgi:hypothetical protein
VAEEPRAPVFVDRPRGGFANVVQRGGKAECGTVSEYAGA